MPEKDIITYVAGLGLSVLGSLGLYNVRQTAALKREVVSESLCGERRDTYQKGIEDKLDAVKADTEKQWNVIMEIRDIAKETKTLVEERGKRRDS